MKSRNIFLKGLLCILLPVLGSVQAWGTNNTYYGRGTATVSSASPTGSGTVYVSTTNSGSGTYANTSSATGEEDGQNSATVTVYAFAKANENYEFVGWNTQNGTTATTSTDNPKTISGSANSTDKNNPTNIGTLYAIFAEKPLFYFSATATVPNGGGTASVSPATTNVRGEHWNSTNATTTATFTATANSGYEFAGWYSDAGLTTQVSTSTTYQATITSTSTNSGNPTNTTLYARFEPIPTFYFSASAVVTPSGAGTASASPSTAHVNGDHWNSTSATTNVTFSAEPNISFFLGWSESANGTILSTDNPYNRNITSTSTNSSSPTNTTLYARFQPYATSITASPSKLTVYVGRSSEPIAHTVSPSGAYDEHTTYESANTAIATVDANGRVTGVATGKTTITVKSLKNDNSTVAASTTVSVNVKNKVATPVITFTPDPNDNIKATATISCGTSSPTLTIRYTINGADPTASTGTIYSNAGFPVNENDIVRAIGVIPDNDLWDISDVATGTYVSCTTNAPQISYVQSGTSANVTITAETGATIYYTTDGTAPTPSSSNGTTTVTINGVASGTTVKAFAQNGSCQASAIVERQIVLSGVSGGVVTLNDFEDHNWSYYSDASTPAQMHSLNPADVKITYYGNSLSGRTTMTSSSENGDKPTTFSETATGVKVGIDADASTFIYYKTLERENADGTGNCLYTTIPNPFSVRPTGSGTNKYRGFYAWRIKSTSNGLSIVDKNGNAFPNNIIPAETEIYFVTSNEYDNEVEFEALWAQAYVGSGYKSTVSYERNFVVGTTAINYPATYSALYPNGTTNGTTAATSVSGTSDPGENRTLNYDTKFEYINLTGSRTYTANNHYLCFGRGISTANNAGTVQGISGNVADMSYTLRVESGQFSAFAFVRSSGATVSGRYLVKAIMGCDYDRATNTNNKLSVAANSTLFFSTSVTYSGSGNKDQKTFDCVFKSGSYQSQQWNGNTQSGQQGYQHVAYLGQNSAGNTYAGRRYVTVEGGEFSGMCGGRGVGSESTTYMTPDVITFDLRIKGGTFHGAVYGGAADNPSIGSRRFIMTGGEIQSWIAGGCNGTGSTSGTGATNGNSYIYVGGTTLVGGDNAMTINDTNGGQVFGAGRGISGRASSVNYSYVAIADEAVVCNNNNTANIPVGGNVYGGSYNGTIATEANVYILGGTVEGGAFGGSYGNGTAIPTANVKMTGGLVKGGVYGGSNNTGTANNVEMHINGGQVGTSSANANIHGGGYGQSTIISGNVDLTLGVLNQTEPGVTVYGDVYGGSALGRVNGTTATDTYHTNVTMNAGTINGSLYGGALGDLQNLGNGHSNVEANVYGPVQVKVYGGSVRKTDANGANGSGGVYGANNINGAPQRSVTVDIYGTDGAPAEDEYALFAVYGGGNKANYSYTNNNVSYPKVTVHNCDNSIEYVYGGGNAANVAATDVKIYGGNKIGYVFGGGNGTVTAANVTGNTSVNIYGGTIGSVFGGSNSKGTIGGTINVSVAKQGDTDPDGSATACSMIIKELYGGGNEANSNAGNITIRCTGDLTDAHSSSPENIGITLEGIGTVYGGANQANIGTAQTASPITLTINSGIVANVYGGNNTSGDIYGTIIVNINKTSDACGWYVGNVFGGGNQAVYDAPSGSQNYPQVNILNGDVSGDVFGGGYGNASDATKGVVNGNPRVVINGANASVAGGVYGGGSLAPTNGDPLVTLTNGATANIYGGGKAANVNGAPTVNINGGTVSTGVFGGCNTRGIVSGAINVTINGGTVGTDATHTANVHGGGYGQSTATGDNVTVTIGNGTSSPTIWGDVYGGSALGNVNDAVTETTKVWLKSGTVNGCLYGGGLGQKTGVNGATSNIAALVNGKVQVIVDGGAVKSTTNTGRTTGNVFGCNNVNGTPKGTVEVQINSTAASTGSGDNKVYALQGVYGGGNLAHYDPTDDTNSYPTVTINGCETSVKDVYGGGNAAAVPRTYVVINGGDIDRVFAGGNGESGTPANVGYKNTDLTPTENSYGPGTANALIKGGTINEVFGGSNANGTIRASGQLEIARPSNGTCDLIITDLYGGGNHAAGAASAISIGCTGTHEGEGITNVYGGANAADVTGDISLTIEEGKITNVYGGNNETGSIFGTITVTINKKADACTWSVNNVFGGGNQAVYIAPTATEQNPTAHNYPVVQILNGEVSGDVFGGGYGNANDATKGVVNGNPQVTINGSGAQVNGGIYGGGSLAPTVGNPVVTLTNGSTVNVFGGGKAAGITGAPTVNINGGSVTTGVYGGCDSSGDVSGDITVNINGGTLGVSGTPLTSGIFGGGFGSSTTTGGNVTVNVGNATAASAAATPTIYGDIYGGSALGTVNDAVADETTVIFNNGTIHGNIYGGGLGAATLLANGYIDTSKPKTEAVVNGTVHVNIGTSTQASNFVTIDGQVFGCNNLAGSPKGHVYVDVYHTAHVAANTYPSPEPASANDVTELTSTAFAIGAVYGGGNLAHYTTTTTGASTHVHIHNCDNTIQYVYGGGNAASSPATDVVIDGGRFNYIFGGGNGAGTGNPGADINGNAAVTLNGGIIYRAFGGSNTKGIISGTSGVSIPEVTTCTRLIHEIFGGGNEAPGGSVDMTIPCGTTGTGIIYAGANNADMGTEAAFLAGNPVLIKLTVEGGNFTQVFGGNNQGGTIWGDVELHLKGGTIENAFGGNNLGGNVKGTIKVFVDEDETACQLVLTNVYGGGYNAAYTPADATIQSPQVYINHIKSGSTILGSVYGGGYGSGATVTANPKVVIGDLGAGQSKIASIAGDVYGGGNAASVEGTTTVIMQKANSTVGGALFGGGNAAGITGSTSVTLSAGTVADGIYGGCNSEGNVTVATHVNINGGTIGASDDRADVFGSGKGHNTGVTTANVNIGQANTVDNNTTYTGAATIYGDVYGGSELGEAGTTIVNLNKATTFIGDVYGGGKGDGTGPETAATITTSATVNQNNLTLSNGKNIYGACNVNGTAAATTVNIIGGTSNDVFGGGNLADMTGSATIVMSGGSAANIYGGGSEADVVGGTNVTVSGGNVTADVFGGGKGQYTTVTGNVLVNIGTSDQTTTGATITGDVYGGSALGAVNATKNTVNDETTYTHTSNSATTVNVYVGTVNGSVYGGGLGQVTGGGIVAHVYGKSTVTIGDATNTSAAPTINGSVYGGSNANGVSEDDVEVNVIRGSITGTTQNNNLTDGNVFGGGKGQPTLVKGSVTVNIGKETAANSGTYQGYAQVAGNVYGGSALGNVNAVYNNNALTRNGNATTSVNLNGGTVTGSVFGGGLGQRASGEGANAVQAILSNVYGPVTVTANGGKAANVFGSNDQNGAPQNTVEVYIKGSDAVESPATYAIGNVYGGGNQADYTYTGSPLKVEVSGGIINNVYGGGLSADVTGSIVVDIKGGQVVNDVYGGGALANTNIGNVSSGYGTGSETISGTDTYTTTVNLTGGTIGNAYGGGLGNFTTPAYVYGDVTVTLGKDDYSIGTAFTHETITPQTGKTVTKTGRLFGANNINGTPKGNITVTVWRTTIFDTNGTIKAKPTRSDDPSVPSIYELAAVYGGGNQANYEPISGKTTIVNIHGCDYSSIEAVYGGGNSASVPATDVNIFGSYEIGFVFGGGNGSEMIKDSNDQWQESPGADVIGLAKVTLKGGEIHDVFGGSNTKGNCGSTSIDDSNSQDGECPLHIINMYGAGKSADVNTDVVMTISGCTTNDGVKNVYAGSYDAKIGGKITLNVRGGILENVFGGNNMGGSISGPIVVNVEETDDCKPIIINNLYGGGNKAAYPGASAVNPVSSITVNVKSCTRIDNLYGGSLDADVDCSTQVNINMVKGKWANIENAILDNYTNIPNIVAGSNGHKKVEDKIGTIGNVYGGGNKGNVLGDAVVNIGTMTVIEFDTVFETIPDYLAPIAITNGDKQEYKVLGARITGNVYGGGNQADVTGNTYVNICAVKENDSYTSVDLSVVRNNNNDNVAEGVKILGSVYGGGNMGSVGTYTVNNNTSDDILDGKPVSFTAGTGTSNVVVLGYAEIGPDNMKMITTSGMPDDAGHIFGASRGTVHFSDIQGKYTTAQLNDLLPQQKLDELAKIAYVDNTEVIIGSYALVKGSVYGGSENGHVLHNTHVTIKDKCQIGVGKNTTSRHPDEVWGENYVPQVDLECASWTYDANDSKPYDIYDYQTGTTPKPAKDGHTFYGNVFGGGSGYYPYARNPYYNDIDDYGYADGLWLRSAGIVEGNTVVDITGGHILTSVYGGNEQTDVLGSTTINMSDGTVGVPRTLAQMQAHPVTCYVFGGGKGDQRKNFNKWTNVGSANVNITGTARIYGSVFGGGEDGHVIGDAVTNIGSSQAGADNSHILIGTTGTSAVDGNIFGGGRGFSGTALTAGVVQGNITVNIYGGTMLGSVFGGGRLASVGTNLVYPEAAVTEDSNGNVTAITNAAGNPLYGTLLDGTDHGNIYVNIYGGTIGATDNNGSLVASAYSIGDVFAGSKGIEIDYRLGQAKNTTLNISGGKIMHNVYGGGEIASLGMITSITEHRNYKEEQGKEGAHYDFGLSWPVDIQFKSQSTEENGVARISITGGRIGTTGSDCGDVFGGGKGMAGSLYEEAYFANVYDTYITINYPNANTTATSSNVSIVEEYDSDEERNMWKLRITDQTLNCVTGSVYGGAEDGHVYHDTHLTLTNGLVGHCLYGGGKGKGKYTTDLLDYFNNGATLDDVKAPSITAGKVYGNTNITMTGGTVLRNIFGGGNLGSLGIGNYSGGTDDYSLIGYGELPTPISIESSTPNNELGLNKITATENKLWENQLFLNSGKATIKIEGGTVGYFTGINSTNLNDATTKDDLPTGNVFGGCRGQAAPNYFVSPRYRYFPEYFLGYVNETEVIIGKSDDVNARPRIYGSVYGGGQDGHVRRDASVTIYNAEIGLNYSDFSSLLNNQPITATQFRDRGNVYGAGSGMGKYSLKRGNVTEEGLNYSSGSVTCSTNVTIYGNTTIYQNVYGGGSLASVGPPDTGVSTGLGFDELNTTTNTYVRPADFSQYTDHGSKTSTNVRIMGGTIGETGANGGYAAGFGGNVYGASRGNVMSATISEADLVRIANSNWTNVEVYDGHVLGDVFGGGEMGAVKDGVTVSIKGGTIDKDVYGGGALANTNTSNWGKYDTYDNIMGAAPVTGKTIVTGLYTLGNNGYTQITTPDQKAASGTTYYDLTWKDGIVTAQYGKAYTKYSTSVNLLGGNIGGDVYGGGLGRVESAGKTAIEAMVYGDVFVNLNGYDERDFMTIPKILSDNAASIGGTEHRIAQSAKGAVVNRIFGANNLNGTPKGHIKIHVFATQSGDVSNTDITKKNPKLAVQGDTGHENETMAEFLDRLIDLYGNIDGMDNVVASARTASDNYEAALISTGYTTALAAYNTAFAAYNTALAAYNAALAACNNATTEQEIAAANATLETATTALQTAKTNLQTAEAELDTASDAMEVTRTAVTEAIAEIYDLLPGLYDVQQIYGGGNLAAYVYGNGEILEKPAEDDPDKTIKDAKLAAARTEVIIDGCELSSIKTVYGGGNAASVPGSYVLVNGSYEIDELFGGGNGRDDYSIDNVYYKNPGANVGYHNYTHVVKSTEAGYSQSTHGSGTVGDPYKAINNTDALTPVDRRDNYSYGSGIATTDIRGGTIHTVFGGSDQKGNIRKSALSVYTESNDDCPITINQTFGGGKDAPMDAEISFNMDCVKESNMIFGGADNADIFSDINMNITNGHIRSVYGGNRKGGALYGTITINIEEKGCTPIVIDSLYSGGYLAPYSIYGYEKKEVNSELVYKYYQVDANNQYVTDGQGNLVEGTKENGKLMPLAERTYANDPATSKDPRINIISATRIGNVYGGGYKARLVGSPRINVNMEEGKMEVYKVEGQDEYVDVYYVSGSTEGFTHEIDDNLTVTDDQNKTRYYTKLPIGNIGTIYGGGFEANVVGDTWIEIGSGRWITGWDNSNEPIYGDALNSYDNTKVRNAATITGDVFGGGDNADVTGNTHIDIANGHIYFNVYGGGKMGSVGTIERFTKHDNVEDGFALSWPYELTYKTGTGTTNINITGGRFGFAGKDVFTVNENGYYQYVSSNKNDEDEANGFPRLDNGDIYGGGKGKAGDRYDMAFIANVNNTNVTISYPSTPTSTDAATSYNTTDSNEDCITGSVYGGAEDGHVYGNTNVILNEGMIGHAIYGGGKGKGTYNVNLHKRSTSSDAEPDSLNVPVYSMTAGKVYGNTNITMNGGYVVRNIFGGGNLGSIGKGNYAGGTDDYTFYAPNWVKPESGIHVGYGEVLQSSLWTSNDFMNSGIATVTILGGTVGTASGIKDDLPTGNIFGGCRGIAVPNVPNTLQPRYLYCPEFYLGYVNEGIVTIGNSTDGTGPRIFGSVYGGGQDGHVRRETNVTVYGGEIGNAYTTANRLLVNTLTPRDLEDPTDTEEAYNARVADHSDISNLQWLHRGNVMGAGSGIGMYDSNKDAVGDKHSTAAGSVTHRTIVNIKGGTIYHNVYGGGSLASVGPPKMGHSKDIDAPASSANNGNGYTDISTKLKNGHSSISIVNIEGKVGDETSYSNGYGGNVFGASRGANNTEKPTLEAGKTYATTFYNEVNVLTGANILGNVFGGGEAGLVYNDTKVNVANFTGATIASSTIGHNVFGGGDQADVNGNTNVNIGGGWIKKNVYGGGNMGSVGTIDATKTEVHDTSKQTGMGAGALYDFGLSWPVKLEFASGTGITNVTVTGGRIGISGKDYMGYDNSLTDEQKYDLREDNGDIYGGSRGEPAERYTEAYNANVNTTNVTIEYPNSLEYEFANISSRLTVNDDKVTIKDGEQGIHGSVYGGGENGHVIGNTNLTLNNGLIGHGMYGGGKGKDTYRGTLKDYKQYKEGNDVEFQTDVASVTAGKVYGNTNVTMNGGYVLRNIYGGGNLASVGKGNYSGGTDDYSLEGYGELPPMDGSAEGSLWTNTDFMNSGICYVTINGGTIGYFDANSNLNAFTKDDLPTGNVFGSCRGMAAPNYNDISPRYLYFPEFFYGYVNQTEVTIGNGTGNGPTILGSVYGGGQDGHVRRDSKVTVNNGNIGLDYSTFSSAISGTDIKDTQFKDRGNIYGAGSGIGKFKFDTRQADPENQGKTIIESGYNYSSGSVTGTTTVTINGGTIYQSVYGGGALASVGPPNIGVDHGLGFDEFKTTDDYSRPAGFEQYNAHLSKSSNNIIIDGGTIGSQAGHTAGYGGNVFGASRGNISNMNLGPTWFLHATTIWTNVKARTGHIFGNVFGGGENGEVKRDTYVEIGGIPVRPAQPNHAPANNNNQEPDSSPAPQRQDQENSQPQNSVNGATQGNVATESLQNRTINTNRSNQ